LVSSAGVISALALSDRAAALATTSLGFMTSVLALVGEHMDAPHFGARKSLGELTSELLDIEREVKEQTLLLLGMSGPAGPCRRYGGEKGERIGGKAAGADLMGPPRLIVARFS